MSLAALVATEPMLGGLTDILSEEKLSRLEAMAATMEVVADKMQAAANTAMLAAKEMSRAAERQVNGAKSKS